MNAKSCRGAVWPIVSCILFGMVVSGLGGVIDYIKWFASFGNSASLFSIWGFYVGVGLAIVYWVIVYYNITHGAADEPSENHCARDR
jgi:phosphotransferase system  glucose/maltose/N-acetylglucosamine-specific IIC component